MFTFNGEFSDLEQVEEYYDDFCKIYDSITQEGKFPYNSSFEGRIKGIEGENESTAIYLLQKLRVRKNREKIINDLKSKGYKEAMTGENVQKFESVVIVGTAYSQASVRTLEKARIVYNNGKFKGVLPKGARSKGYRGEHYSLILAK